MNSIQKILGNPTGFLKLIFKNLRTYEVDVSGFLLDHICYRTESIEHYNSLKNDILKENELLIESEINGRKISVFKLKTPLEFLGRKIPLLELPAPKPESFYKKGWEHVEFVSPGSLEDFLKNNSSLEFDKKGFSKEFNRDLRIKFGGISVKFHEQSLEEVIRIENTN